MQFICIYCSEQFSTAPSGTVISSQISKNFIELPENGRVILKFNNVRKFIILI